MIRKTVKYEDFDGVEHVEDFYFNFTKAEVVEMEAVTDDGLDKKLIAIVESKNKQAIIDTFKDIVRRAYGVKSADGRRFIKTLELQEEFTQTNAYSEIFLELATDASAGADFINGIIPKAPLK